MVALLLCNVATAQLVWTIDSVQADSGSEVTLNVVVDNFTDMISAQGTIQWNDSVLEFMHITDFGLLTMNGSNIGNTQGEPQLTFSWYDASLLGESLSNGTVFFALTFKVLGAPGGSSAIAFENAPLPLEFVDVNFSDLLGSYNNGAVVVPDAGTGIGDSRPQQELKAWPNPCTSNVTLSTKGIASGTMLHVIDAAGKVQTQQLVTSGNANLNTAQWANGQYWLLVEQEGPPQLIQLVKQSAR